jgi:hypothetical protein
MIPGFSDGLNVLAKAFAKVKALPLKTSPRRSWSVTWELGIGPNQRMQASGGKVGCQWLPFFVPAA